MSSNKQKNDSVSATDNEIDEIDLHKYIVFKLGSELYGTPLLAVREVVEEMPIKPLPNTIESFRGVCNLRGQIIGVINLSAQFNIEHSASKKPVLMVFDSGKGALAVQVDHIETVTVIPPENIEIQTGLLASLDHKFIHGIGKLNDRLVTLIDLKSILSTQELMDVSNSKLLPKREAG
jgi:purine-binding chemotaxis protein CheW